MQPIRGTYKDGTIILDNPADWPEGCRVLVEPEPSTEVTGMTEDDQRDDPESLRQWLEAFDAIPPLPMTAEEEVELQAWRKKVKDFNVEAVRRQMERDGL